VIRKFCLFSLALVALVLTANTIGQAQQSLLTRHVRPASKLAGAKLMGKLPDDTPMQLHVMLNLGDPDGLKSFVAQVTDPTSPYYKHYLTPKQFTARFGPSQQNYDTVVAYFKANGFTVVGGSLDGFDVQVKAPAAVVEKALHITVNQYQRPSGTGTSSCRTANRPWTCRSSCGTSPAWTRSPSRTRCL
jgi:hypothetical protein